MVDGDDLRMEQDPQRLIELAGEVLDAERKYGLIRRTASRVFGRKTKNQPAEAIDYRQEVVKAALENAVDKIASQDLTVEQAFQIVERVVTFGDLEKLNSTWQNHWSEGASKVGIDDEERRTWWARLLAGEIQHPGTFSLRTIAVMDTLSTEEALLFTKLCGYVWAINDDRELTLILPPEKSTLWSPDFSQITLLVNCGLVMYLSTGTSLTSDIRQAPSKMRLKFDNYIFTIDLPAQKSARLRTGALQLTPVGEEIYRLTKPSYLNQYRDEIAAEWRQSYTVHELPTAAT